MDSRNLYVKEHSTKIRDAKPHLKQLVIYIRLKYILVPLSLGLVSIWSVKLKFDP
jgi:hypothetical protein